jgi:hypothetical protein
MHHGCPAGRRCDQQQRHAIGRPDRRRQPGPHHTQSIGVHVAGRFHDLFRCNDQVAMNLREHGQRLTGPRLVAAAKATNQAGKLRPALGD